MTATCLLILIINISHWKN